MGTFTAWLVFGGETALLGHSFVRDLAVVLCVAAVTTVLFQRFRQPVVLGYLLAGVIVGPHITPSLITDISSVHMLSELGVILLLFSLGLEFRFTKILALGPSAAFTALLEVGALLYLGYTTARLLGWSPIECLFGGAIVSISSTVLIQKVFAEIDIQRKIRELVFGILIFEDIVAVLLLTTLAALSGGARIDTPTVTASVLRLVLFLVITVGLGLVIVPPAVRMILALRRKETIVVACVGLSFAMALIGEAAGCSLALGAFLAGMLVAESGEGEYIEGLVRPVHDVFAAVFFVSIGMLIDPNVLVEHWGAVLALFLVVLVGKVASVTLGVFLTGRELSMSLRTGLCLAQIGELSFVIAALGVTSGAAGDFLSPVAVGVSSLTAFTSPWLIRDSEKIAAWIERHLPRPLRTFAALYGSWVATIRATGSRDQRWRGVRRAAWIIVLDGALLAVFLIAGGLGHERGTRALNEVLALSPRWSQAIVVGVIAGACVFPWTGVARGAKRLAATLAELALPAVAKGRVDTAAAPRRTLVVALEFAVVVCVVVPITVVTAPFLPRFGSPLIVVLFVAPIAYMLWRSAANLDGHLRAGAEVVVEALARGPRDEHTRAMGEVTTLLPGMGDLTMLRIDPGSPAEGKRLGELSSSLFPGVRVVAIVRGEQRLVMPTDQERLAVGDLVALTGSSEAVERTLRYSRLGPPRAT